METMTVLVTGHVDGVCNPAWLKAKLQGLLDGQIALDGIHLRVKLVEVTSINEEGGVHRAQTKVG